MRLSWLRATIPKIYVSNFLTGLVFWYGIEKLFMREIGISPAQIGILLAVMSVVTLLSDIPAGMLADKWSRKGVLVLSSVCLALASVLCGTSTGLSQYLVGYVLYGLYLVFTSGTYQALVYDVLHEQKRERQYSKIMGRAFALFLAGAGVGNIVGGYVAELSTLQATFIISIMPCVINMFLTATIKEPTFHKKEQKEKMLKQLGQSVRGLLGVSVLRALLVMWCALALTQDLFGTELGQLYLLQFTSAPVLLGFLWAGVAFGWALGSALAHRLKNRLSLVVIFSFVPLIALGFTEERWGMALYFVQVVISAAAVNLIETHVQDNTPSAVRTSTLSVLTSINRLVVLPASLAFGWLISRYDVFVMVQVFAAVSAVALLYWLITGARRIQKTPELELVAADFNKP